MVAACFYLVAHERRVVNQGIDCSVPLSAVHFCLVTP
jgi:hypothetical protein